MDDLPLFTPSFLLNPAEFTLIVLISLVVIAVMPKPVPGGVWIGGAVWILHSAAVALVSMPLRTRGWVIAQMFIWIIVALPVLYRGFFETGSYPTGSDTGAAPRSGPLSGRQPAGWQEPSQAQRPQQPDPGPSYGSDESQEHLGLYPPEDVFRGNGAGEESIEDLVDSIDDYRR